MRLLWHCPLHNKEVMVATAGLLAPLSAGAAIILPASGGFSASHFWQDATRFKATFYTAVPTMHQVTESQQQSKC